MSKLTQDEMNQKIESLISEVILQKDYDKLSSFQQFQHDRNAMLNVVPLEKRNLIEKIITIRILEIFKKRKGDYFSYEDFYEIDEIIKYFPIFLTTGDRNIGKTTSAKRLMRNEVAKGNKFLMTRNIQEEVKAQIKSDVEIFLEPNGWKYDNEKAPNITNMDDKIIGYYRDINTIGKYKSIEFPNVTLIVAEEFSSRVSVSNKFDKLTEFVTTVQRHREDLKLIMQSNFVDQNDEVLQKLGIGLKGLGRTDFVRFNWISGAIMIFIPKGVYKSTSDNKEKERKYLGKSLALNDFDSWKSQFGGGFTNEEPANVINGNDIVSMEPVFNIYYEIIGAVIKKITLYNTYIKIDEDSERIFEQVLMETLEANDKPIFVFDNRLKIRYPKSMYLSHLALENLILNWQSGDIKTTSTSTFDVIIKLFAKGKDMIESNNSIFENIDEI